MVAGPWFAVQQNGAGWFDFGTVWFSDGGHADGPATVQLRLDLDTPEVLAGVTHDR